MQPLIPATIIRVVRGIRNTEKMEGLCPHCKWTQADFDKTQLLGCPLCYEVFRAELLGSPVYPIGPDLRPT
jgi:protein-arginine kinase activator protein McsA